MTMVTIQTLTKTAAKGIVGQKAASGLAAFNLIAPATTVELTRLLLTLTTDVTSPR